MLVLATLSSLVDDWLSLLGGFWLVGVVSAVPVDWVKPRNIDEFVNIRLYEVKDFVPPVTMGVIRSASVSKW